MTVHIIWSTCISLARAPYFCSLSLNYSLHRKHAANNCDQLALTFLEEALLICFNPELSRFSSCFPWSCSKLKSSAIKVRSCFSAARPYNFSGFLAYARVITVPSPSLAFFLSKMLKPAEDDFIQASTLSTVFSQTSEAMTSCKENSSCIILEQQLKWCLPYPWEKT